MFKIYLAVVTMLAVSAPADVLPPALAGARTAPKVLRHTTNLSEDAAEYAGLRLPSFYHAVGMVGVINHPYSFGSEPVSKGMNSSNDVKVRRCSMLILSYCFIPK